MDIDARTTAAAFRTLEYSKSNTSPVPPPQLRGLSMPLSRSLGEWGRRSIPDVTMALCHNDSPYTFKDF